MNYSDIYRIARHYGGKAGKPVTKEEQNDIDEVVRTLGIEGVVKRKAALKMIEKRIELRSSQLEAKSELQAAPTPKPDDEPKSGLKS